MFLLRNPGCACFGSVGEICFVLSNLEKCLSFGGRSAELAREVWARTASVCSQQILVEYLTAAGFPAVLSLELLESLQKEEILFAGREDQLASLLAPRLSPLPVCDHLLVCVTGAIHSANFSPYLQNLRIAFCEELKIILTESARKLVQPKALLHLCASEVYCDAFEDVVDIHGAPHVCLSRWASCVLVAPATAASIHRIAYGSCDDLVALTVASTPKGRPVVIAPSMNETMWFNSAVQENVSRCRRLGYWIIEPGFGYEVSKSWDKRDLRVGGLGAAVTTLPYLMTQIFQKHQELQRGLSRDCVAADAEP